MVILLLTTGFLIERELFNAVKNREETRGISLALPELPSPDQAGQAVDVIRRYLPDMVLSLNCNGLDAENRIAGCCARAGIPLVNWFVDNPFFYELYSVRPVPRGPDVFHFISDNSYVEAGRARGWRCAFLPLAYDPEFFNPEKGRDHESYDVIFVGNSTLDRMSVLITEEEETLLESFGPLLARCREAYAGDATINIDAWLRMPGHREQWWDRVGRRDRFTYLAEWFIGYLHRKDCIVTLARQRDFSFFCYGDTGWKNIIDPGLTSTRACYYDNLCEIYHASAININITRSQIREGFNQRVFDTLGSGSFLLTDRRPCNSRYFRTSGPERELVEFSSIADCREKIRYYLARPDERAAIAAAGHERVRSRHTYAHRLETMIGAAGGREAGG